jgi:membrane peptidoglycan carboxypeptidase
LDEETATKLNDMMQRAITDYETGAQIPGIKVAGKTGTAEAPNEELHSWFITFAPADDPEIAVAVLVENGQEGYKSALPIARRLMEAHLRSTGTLSQESQRGNQPAEQQKETTQPARSPNPAPGQVPGKAPDQAPSQPPGQAPKQAPFQFPFQNPFQPPAQGPNQVPPGKS